MKKENVVNKNKCFPGGLLSGVSRLYSRLVNKETSLFYQQRISGRSRIKCGITPNFKGVGPVFARPARTGAPLRSGFTLIELLVVVLIIGILAAAALPQYQKAVWRSRNTQLKTLVKSVGQAREAYYIANGSYPSNFDEMNIDLPLTRAAGASPYFMSAGTDAVRSGSNFLIGIALDGTVYGLWKSGPYDGAGFLIADDDILKCVERWGCDGINKFCVSLERGTNKQTSGFFNIYDLP